MLILAGLAAITLLVSYLFMLRRSILILAYHGISTGKSPLPGLVIHPESFRRHMTVLAALGLRAEPLDDVVRDLTRGRIRNGPRLCLTFDDGYRSIRGGGLDLLREMRWPATIFVPTEHVGKWNSWDEIHQFERMDLLAWDELRALSREGFQIGSHGKAHRSLLGLSEREASEELRDSLAALKSQVPSFSLVFSYPFGHRRPEHADWLRDAGYIAACSLAAGALAQKKQIYDLGRLLVRSDSVWRLGWDLSLYPIKSWLRSAVQAWRRVQ